ncbi:MAG: hypothetical protein AMJ84_05320 [Acidithiobacillales bacterium SM23_46]|nr:MAG: hypothetical protein AMJ84_05320 [Acidithiobacillales bacterium SM23_46]
MSRIFLVGAGPMMDGGACRVTAHAWRTWHFVSALRHAGHEVALYTVSQTISPLDPLGQFAEPRTRDGVAYENLDMRAGNMLAYLIERYQAFRPDCVVGVSTEPASWACRMRPTVPVWADLHGWVMAEAQLKAARDGNDDILSHFWQHERPILRRADTVSVVSTAQRFALLGELATVGRLNRHNVRHDLVVTIPSSVDFTSLAKPSETDCIRRLVGGDDAFVVLWSGSFNTWTDAATLFDALEWVMTRDSTVHFVATGGAIPGHVDSVFEAFSERVSRSPHGSRYHLVGWVGSHEFPAYLAGSHLAVCVDFPCLETSVGTRTRLVEAMAYGLPVLITRGTELSTELEREHIGWVLAPGEPQALGERILKCAGEREQTASMGKRARRFVEQHYAIEQTMEPFLRWADRPCFAPDNALKRGESPTIFEAATNRLESDARALDDIEDIPSLAEARRELERLRSQRRSRLWRFWQRR